MKLDKKFHVVFNFSHNLPDMNLSNTATPVYITLTKLSTIVGCTVWI